VGRPDFPSSRAVISFAATMPPPPDTDRIARAIAAHARMIAHCVRALTHDPIKQERLAHNVATAILLALELDLS
jgi:hypothetical protein